MQRINEAYPPKGHAVPDLEIFRRVGAKLFPTASEFRVSSVDDLEQTEAVAT